MEASLTPFQTPDRKLSDRRAALLTVAENILHSHQSRRPPQSSRKSTASSSPSTSIMPPHALHLFSPQMRKFLRPVLSPEGRNRNPGRAQSAAKPRVGGLLQPNDIATELPAHSDEVARLDPTVKAIQFTAPVPQRSRPRMSNDMPVADLFPAGAIGHESNEYLQRRLQLAQTEISAQMHVIRRLRSQLTSALQASSNGNAHAAAAAHDSRADLLHASLSTPMRDRLIQPREYFSSPVLQPNTGPDGHPRSQNSVFAAWNQGSGASDRNTAYIRQMSRENQSLRAKLAVYQHKLASFQRDLERRERTAAEAAAADQRRDSLSHSTVDFLRSALRSSQHNSTQSNAPRDQFPTAASHAASDVAFKSPDMPPKRTSRLHNSASGDSIDQPIRRPSLSTHRSNGRSPSAVSGRYHGTTALLGQLRDMEAQMKDMRAMGRAKDRYIRDLQQLVRDMVPELPVDTFEEWLKRSGSEEATRALEQGHDATPIGGSVGVGGVAEVHQGVEVDSAHVAHPASVMNDTASEGQVQGGGGGGDGTQASTDVGTSPRSESGVAQRDPSPVLGLQDGADSRGVFAELGQLIFGLEPPPDVARESQRQNSSNEGVKGSALVGGRSTVDGGDAEAHSQHHTESMSLPQHRGGTRAEDNALASSDGGGSGDGSRGGGGGGSREQGSDGDEGGCQIM